MGRRHALEYSPYSILVGDALMHLQPTPWAALATFLLALAPLAPASAAENTVRAGVLKFGTVQWELDVIKTHGLAAAEGVDLQVVPYGASRATAIALQGGAVDVIVSDWIWVSRQRAEGRDYTFVPHSLAVGGLIVRPDAGIEALDDLAGKRVGVAGGPVDKSWLLLQAYAKRDGRNLAEMVEPTFGAPPLLNELIGRGDLPAVLNFWHYNARLKAAGMRELIAVAEILPALGVQGPVPLLGWVFDRTWAEANRDAVLGFLRASYAAKRILLESDAEWARLRPKLKVKDDATATALRDAYRQGIPRRFDERDRESAAKVFAVLAREGGAKLVGSSDSLAPGTFWTEFELPSWR
jgi:NitT/TauT family transport system substrate-binding protein